MIAPAVFGIVVFTVIPAIQMVVWSFYDINQLNPAKTRFIGFGNYTRIFQSADFTRALVNTGVSSANSRRPPFSFRILFPWFRSV